MAEEKQTPANNEPYMHQDDIEALRYVLQHVSGSSPISLSVPVYIDDEASA